MFTIMYLQSDIFDQMQLHLKDFLKNSHFKQEDIMNKIFNKFSKFKKHNKIVFKDIDVKYTAERKLISL